MKHPLALALAVALSTLALGACQSDTQTATEAPAAPAADGSASAEEANPLLVASTLPLQYPAFDKISDAHFGPAFDQGMAESLKEVAVIAGDPAPRTFENTIIALERAGQTLQRATTVFFALVGADTNDARKKIQAEYAPRFAAHQDEIALNPLLFKRIDTLYNKRDELGLDAEGLRLLERYHTNFVRAGARLDDNQKARLKEINGELAQLGTRFSQNVLAEVNDSAVVVDTVEELDGLSDEAIAAAAEAARA